TDPGGYSNEPDGQPVVLANALIFQMGQIPGVNYGHSIAQYGAEGVRHLMDMFELNTVYHHIAYLAMPLGYDWLFDLMTEQQRQTAANKLLEYAQPENPYIRAGNNPPGMRLLGALAVHGDSQYVDQTAVTNTLNLFYNGLVF